MVNPYSPSSVSAFSRTPGFTASGATSTVVPRGMVPAEAFKLADLEWDADVVEAYAPVMTPDGVGFEPIPRSRAVVRPDRGEPIASVGTDYTPITNTQLRRIVEEVCDLDAGAHVEAAMNLDGGRDVVVQVKLREWAIGSDASSHYLTLWNNNTGRTPLRAFETGTRVWCGNVLVSSFAMAEAYFTVRHTTNSDARVRTLVKALRKAHETSERWEDAANRLATTTPTQRDAGRLIVDLACIIAGPQPHARVEVLDDVQAAKVDKWRGKVERVAEAFLKDGKRFGAASPAEAGTLWDLANRFTGWIDHESTVRRREGARTSQLRLQRALEPTGLASDRKRAGVDLLLASIA